MKGQMKEFIIYILSDPRTNQVRYVGKSENSLYARLKDHLHPKRGLTLKDHCHRWLNELVSSGFEPGAKVIEWVSCPENLLDRETFWIRKYRNDGSPLTNLTEGGRGTKGWKWSPEMAAHMKKIMSGTGNPFYGQGHRQRDKDNPMYGNGHKIAGGKNPMARRVLCLNDGNVFASGKEAAGFYGLTKDTICRLCQKEDKYPSPRKRGGYSFAYAATEFELDSTTSLSAASAASYAESTEASS